MLDLQLAEVSVRHKISYIIPINDKIKEDKIGDACSMVNMKNAYKILTEGGKNFFKIKLSVGLY